MQVTAKFAESLAVILMKLVEQRTAGRISQSLKNGVHAG